MTDAHTWSKRPFVSYDGPDVNGVRAEVKVGVGFARVVEIKDSKNGGAKQVVFQVDGSEYTSTGWTPNDSNVLKIAEEALSSNEPIHWRIESKRKKINAKTKDPIPRDIPIMELTKDATTARDNIDKSLAAVRREDDADWTISPMALTRIDEDPKEGGSSSAYDYSLEELQASNPNFKGSPTTSAPSNNSYGIESTPYFLKNKDGKTNPGSIAVSVPLTVYYFVKEYMEKNGITEDQVNKAQMFKVIDTILLTANKAQLGIYGGELERPDFIFGSHTRARQLVFGYIEHEVPLTAEIMADNEKLAKWHTEALEKINAMWRWSMGKVESICIPPESD